MSACCLWVQKAKVGTMTFCWGRGRALPPHFNPTGRGGGPKMEFSPIHPTLGQWEEGSGVGIRLKEGKCTSTCSPSIFNRVM